MRTFLLLPMLAALGCRRVEAATSRASAVRVSTAFLAAEMDSVARPLPIPLRSQRPPMTANEEGLVRALSRPALVAVATSGDGGHSGSSADAAPSARIFLIAREAGFIVVDETRLSRPTPILLVDGQWAPCSGSASRRVTLKSFSGEPASRVEALVVEGCPAFPNFYGVMALEGVSGARIRRIVDAAATSPSRSADPEVSYMNSVLRKAGQPVLPIRLDLERISRNDPSIRAALEAAERHPDVRDAWAALEAPHLRGSRAQYLVERVGRRFLVFWCPFEVAKLVELVGDRPAVVSDWSNAWTAP